jgi:hypothetical protein
MLLALYKHKNTATSYIISWHQREFSLVQEEDNQQGNAKYLVYNGASSVRKYNVLWECIKTGWKEI